MSGRRPGPEERAALSAAAEAWLEQDPDPQTRTELRELLDAAAATDAADAWRALHDRFRTRLAFGTAGLRGELGAGPNRMNRVLVAQTARGFAEYLLSREPEPSIVVGYDARIRSDVFARDTAEIMQAAGVRATLLPHRAPTPVLAFAVRELGASAGVMVTASHNPKRDNGYKVYLGGADGGSQIVSPADAEIAARIDRVAAEMRVPDIPRDEGYAIADEAVLAAYVERTAACWRGEAGATLPPIVYTPLHGVGWDVFRAVLDRLGLAHPTPVAAQLEPDGAFPTLDFPNPEEPGALELAYRTAEEAGAGIVLAHDPDADRLAVAVRRADGWHRFGGNDIGKLLGWRAAEANRAGTLATSLVSSPALRAVAESYGLGYAETPTGFKWISRAEGIVYGYEEALGYLVDPEKVRDKDGISAALAVLELIARLDGEGRGLTELEAEFTERFGAFASRQVSERFAEATEIPRIMAALRDDPPRSVGGAEVVAFDDYREGLDGIPPSELLRIRLADGTRIMVRPSGTEPKIKCYVDARSEQGDARRREAAAAAAADRAAAAMRELFARI